MTDANCKPMMQWAGELELCNEPIETHFTVSHVYLADDAPDSGERITLNTRLLWCE